MKTWTYFISIPFVILLCIGFWYQLNITLKSGGFDATIAWIIGGTILHSALIALSYHCYMTVTDSWTNRRRKK